MRDLDVAVVGGGLSGLTAAAFAGRAGLAVGSSREPPHRGAAPAPGTKRASSSTSAPTLFMREAKPSRSCGSWGSLSAAACLTPEVGLRFAAVDATRSPPAPSR